MKHFCIYSSNTHRGAENISPETLAFIVRYSSGVICAAAPGETLDHLNIGPMVSKNEDPKGTAFGVSIDLATDEITTGISAADRASTLRAMARPSAEAAGFNRPGHIFPLRARAGGVLERDGLSRRRIRCLHVFTSEAPHFTSCSIGLR